MTLVWLSDIHLDRATPDRIERFIDQLRKTRADAAILTGDTAHAVRLVTDLQRVAEALDGPLWFVLGNHDHYGSSVGAVRDAVLALGQTTPNAGWLPPAGVVTLPDKRALVGVDGWADGRHGSPLTTPVLLNDDHLIAELARQDSRRARLVVRRTLADADAVRLATLLDRAASAGHRSILVATHVPPFVEALPPGSRVAHPDWYPVLVSGATGRVLKQFAARHPTIDIEVLAGHSHRHSDTRLAPNLRVRVAEARYGDPRVLRV
jgi:predicted phosphohydrolase